MNRWPKPVLRIEDLHVEFPGVTGTVSAVRGVDLTVRPGDIVGVVGESGSGKSVTALSILRLLPPHARVRGRILLGDQSILDLPERDMVRIRGRLVGMVFQEPMTSLNPAMRVGTLLSQVIRYHAVIEGRRIPQRQAWQEAEEALRRVQIPDPAAVLRRYPHELSGGMRQRILIALATVSRPRLLICDEPTTALDVTVQAQILRLISDLAQDTGAGVLFITHDLGVVAQLCHQVAVMYAGRIVETGPVSEVLTNPRHPYTKGLLQSTPDPYGPLREVAAIPGAPPDPAQLPPGCAFHPRCPLAQDKCRAAEPSLVPVNDHRVACWVATEASVEAAQG